MKLFHQLVALLVMGARAVTPSVPQVPVTMKFNEHAFAKRRYGKAVSGGQTILGSALAMVRAFFAVLTPRRICALALLAVMLALPHAVDALALTAEAALILPPEISKKKRDHDLMLTEVYDTQQKFKGKPMPQDVGESLEEKMKEAETLWEEIEPHVQKAEDRLKGEQKVAERRKRLEQLEADGKHVHDPTMPRDHGQDEGKIAGYIGLGAYVTAQQAFHEAKAGNFRASVQLGEIPVGLAFNAKHHRGPNGEPLIPLTREQRKAIEQVMESKMDTKSLVSIGSGVIEPQRLSVEPKVTADDRIRIRDVIPIGQTGAPSVGYIREESFTRSAAETTPGNLKPEGALSYTEQTATVRTIPAWIPVTTDQLSDWPGLRSRVDNRLLYDIRKREAEQIIYGDGAAPNLQGLLDISGTQDISADSLYDAGADLLEKIRLGLALVETAGYDANAVLMHPMDWHQVVTAKGSDNHYLGQVFMTADRQPRLWSVDVVTDKAMQATAGVATEARNLIVGDFIRGCELLDRMQANVMIGLNSDDFTKNRRTILAEERVAFPIYAPAAFAFLETRASAT